MKEGEVLTKIKSKRDFSKLPEKDIFLAYSKFARRDCSEEEKIRLTRDLLRKIYSAFVSTKLLNIKDKDATWFLRKHLSTKERLPFYTKVYSKIFSEVKNCSVLDLGAGINGLSYGFFPKKVKVDYIAIEAVGQLVELMEVYFKKNNFNAKAIHGSLFELDNVKKILNQTKSPKIVFLLKVLDSLEMMEPDYSKLLLKEIAPLCDRVVVSFATRSMIKRERFKVNRKWIVNFIKENFELLDDFEMGNERYLELKKKSKFK